MIFLDLFTKKSKRSSAGDVSAISLLEWQINAKTCTLSNRETDAVVRITPRGMEVLMHFIENPNQVISARVLLELFWSKSVRSDHAVHNTIAELRSALGDQASNPKYIKTYPKRGYALLPTPSMGMHLSRTEQHSSEKNERSRWGVANNPILYPSILLLTVSVFLFFANIPKPSQTVEAPLRTLVVHELESIDIGTDALYLSQQLPGSLVSTLNRLPGANLAVENGVLGTSGQEDYVLNGSIQRINDQNRLQINLTDARTKTILLSDQFNFVSEEIFTIQDQIVQHVATALRIYLDDEQRNEMLDWGTFSPVAYDAFLKAEFYSKESNNKSFTIALDNYLLAVEKDPDFANAYLGIANVAARRGVYSNTENNVENRRLVSFALRELLRLDASSQEAQAVQLLALRVEGNNHTIIEEKIRSIIVDEDSAPNFAISHYSNLLLGAKMFSEAQALLLKVPDRTPYRVSTDATWTYRNGTIQPDELIPLQKQQLLVRPSHIGVLGSLARSYAFMGDYDQATFYLSQQLELDQDGQSAMLSQVIISALFGESISEGNQLEALNADNPEFNFAMGVKHFILGEIDAGVTLWRNLTPSDNRRLFAWIHTTDIFFPSQVLQDSRYNATLEEIGAGASWQRQLMEGLLAMSPVTGVDLSESSKKALAQSKPLMRNNLWDHSVIQYPESTPPNSHKRPHGDRFE